MAVEIIMPKLGMGMKEGTVVEWLKRKGDKVEKGESVAVISSEKIEKDIEAPGSGVLLDVAAQEDETVAVGKAIGYIGEPGEKINSASESEKQPVAAAREAAASVEKAGRPPINMQIKVRVSPAARKLAKAEGIDVNTVKGTGPQGRVTREDIEKAIKNRLEDKNEQTTEEQQTDSVTVKQITGMRKVIAERMFSSIQQSAQLTIHMRADVTEMLSLRKKINAGQENINLTVTDFIARAVVLALQKHKNMNGTFVDNQINCYDSVHLGIAVALENGLVVPVIRQSERYSMEELSNKIKMLSKKARDGSLDASEMKGSTFTITSLGASGVEFFTPILNPPEVGILGVGLITDTPVFVGEELKRQSLLPLSLTFDHRAVDGVPASEFLSTIKGLLENPYKMLI
ncbi:dihydrolipoamide acetyltransferase family protein [Siminovitchia fortis]|uniref:Dihydrolipoamide acetyltransferase component of pyruvate dehydrogenase complex n=1 Tax=Siminovitchia fortis TaxID=254758 RepID=A0A443J2U8_9BACI|nr:dihydrolipoamide acetyltransferase family protein [Siminovitchia fortis]RWR14656.1 2-oxo acid dehydrogenase subunit E2 [Siminovitchia fortis]WHY80338.1 dihydrolipoamide acetyltransferase family protein [Siminovitchia fortis]